MASLRPLWRSAWAEKLQISICHIQPGKPQQNAYVEHYNRTVRHEWLGQNIIGSIEEAQSYATKWLWTYNNERTDMVLGGITPAQKLSGLLPVLLTVGYAPLAFSSNSIGLI